MNTVIQIKNRPKRPLPEQFRADDVRYAEELVEYFLKEFTAQGDVLLDPFMGYGTTLLVAENLGRVAYGIEYEQSRWHYVRSILKFPDRALQGDATRLSDLALPMLDFCMTSPPYMGRHHTENPFTAYSTVGGGYAQYLKDLREIFVQIAEKLKTNGKVVVEVSNLKHDDAPLTTLAWDIAGEISKVLRFEGEVVVCWEGGYGYGYEHSYALVFSKN